MYRIVLHITQHRTEAEMDSKSGSRRLAVVVEVEQGLTCAPLSCPSLHLPSHDMTCKLCYSTGQAQGQAGSLLVRIMYLLSSVWPMLS